MKCHLSLDIYTVEEKLTSQHQFLCLTGHHFHKFCNIKDESYPTRSLDKRLTKIWRREYYLFISLMKLPTSEPWYAWDLQNMYIFTRSATCAIIIYILEKYPQNYCFYTCTGWFDWKLSKVNYSGSECGRFWPYVVKTKMCLTIGSFILIQVVFWVYRRRK